MKQPVLIKSLEDKLGATNGNVTTPAIPGSTLQAGKEEDIVNSSDSKRYRQAVGKLLYLAR
jgi:hypothetical protein